MDLKSQPTLLSSALRAILIIPLTLTVMAYEICRLSRNALMTWIRNILGFVTRKITGSPPTIFLRQFYQRLKFIFYHLRDCFRYPTDMHHRPFAANEAENVYGRSPLIGMQEALTDKERILILM